jgi:hypothetical protein
MRTRGGIPEESDEEVIQIVSDLWIFLTRMRAIYNKFD